MSLRTRSLPVLDAVADLVHGFETKDPRHSAESRDGTRARVAQALADRGRLCLLSQVHGAAVREAPWTARPEGDASFSRERGVILGIETADCLPLLFVDPRNRVVAAAHAGWRGTVAGVARAVVGALLDRGSKAGDVVAALGPAIGACCYEVGPEVEDAFGSSGRSFFITGPRGRPHLDLRAANKAQLLSLGLSAERIHSVAECTRCLADRYHSFRRDGTTAGRMISFVGYARPVD